MKKGAVHFINASADFEPKYAINFTIARYNAGVYRSLEFDYGMKINEFDEKVEVEDHEEGICFYCCL